MTDNSFVYSFVTTPGLHQMSFKTKSSNPPADGAEDPNIVPGSVAVVDETKPRTRSRMDSLVSKLSIKGRSSTRESSGDSNGRSSVTGRPSISRKDEPVILNGNGLANENHVALNAEKEVYIAT